VKISAFSDADWAGDVSDSKSTSGYLILMAGAPVIWRTVRQKSVSKSSTAAETAAADACLEDIIWTRELLNFIGFPQTVSTPLHIDNQATIHGIVNGNTTSRNKYFRVRIDALHDAINDEIIKPIYQQSEELSADALTKSVSGPKLLKHRRSVNVMSVQDSGMAGIGIEDDEYLNPVQNSEIYSLCTLNSDLQPLSTLKSD
jgi:hypothetical protein